MAHPHDRDAPDGAPAGSPHEREDVWAPPSGPALRAPTGSASPPPGSDVGTGTRVDGGDTPTDGGTGRGRGVRVALAVGAVALVVLLVATVALVLPGGSDDATSTADGGTGSSQDGGGAGDAAAVQDLVPELSRFVEEQYGQTFREPVEVELLDDDAFVERLLEDEEEDVDELAGTDATLTALGLVGSEVDVAEELDELLGGGVVGFYDPETDELVVRGADTGPAVRATLVHELAHALQDQLYDLDRPELDDAPDESGFGLSTVAEGDAERVQDAYVDTFSAEEADRYAQEQAQGDIPDVPVVLLRLLVEPYVVGPPFVAAVVDEGGLEGLGEAFRTPPSTSEQLRHPELYLSGEGALDVVAPAADGEVLDDGVLGESSLALLFGDDDEATLGWGGDRYVTYRADGSVCTRVAYRGDTPSDTRQLAEAWEGLDHGGLRVTVEQPATADQPLLLRSCVRDEVA